MKHFFLILASALITNAARAEDGFKPNYDEAAVPAYRLPDPLVFENGLPVKDADDWEKRRAEILALFGTHIYGHTPTTGEVGITHEKRKSIGFLAGKAVLEEIRISVTNKQARTRHIDLLLIKPKAPEGTALRTFLTINFLGNHTLHPSPDISLPESWQSQQPDGIVVNHRATEKGRGYSAAGWPIETIIDSGIAFASVCYHDIEPDSPEHYGESVRAFFDKPEADGWGAIGAWAWGLSRAMDYIVTDPQIDARRVAVMGHSRLGKAALWAAAQDQRFALAISNNSGCGGAALSRRAFGETVQRINQGFPYWFCKNFHQYNNNESALPVDQHQLISLIAPRMVHIASAENDRWADPRGEFLSALHASPVWKLHGLKGIEATEMPPIHQPIGDRVRYHIRAGEHDVTEYDWKQYIDSLLMVP